MYVIWYNEDIYNIEETKKLVLWDLIEDVIDNRNYYQVGWDNFIPFVFFHSDVT